MSSSDPDTPDDLEGRIEDHVHLGAKQPFWTFDTLPKRYLNDAAFTNF
jgi:hypothetical protein